MIFQKGDKWKSTFSSIKFDTLEEAEIWEQINGFSENEPPSSEGGVLTEKQDKVWDETWTPLEKLRGYKECETCGQKDCQCCEICSSCPCECENGTQP